MVAEPADEKTTPAARTPRAVINEAIRETARFNTLIYCGLVLFGLTGVAAIAVAIFQGNAWIGGIGAVPAALCWPAMRYAILIRQQNVALRMLELALNNVNSADEALKAINQAYGFHFGDREVKEDVAVSKSKRTGSRSGSEDY